MPTCSSLNPLTKAILHFRQGGHFSHPLCVHHCHENQTLHKQLRMCPPKLLSFRVPRLVTSKLKNTIQNDIRKKYYSLVRQSRLDKLKRCPPSRPSHLLILLAQTRAFEVGNVFATKIAVNMSSSKHTHVPGRLDHAR